MVKLFNKLFSYSERTLISKDFSNLWKNRGTAFLLAIIPAILVFILPIVFLTAICLIPDNAVNDISSISGFIPETLSSYSYKQGLYYIFVHLLSPMLFLLVPLLTAALSTVFVFVGERENMTIETLVYSSLSSKTIFKSKAMCVFLNSLVLSLVSFVIIEIIISIGNIILDVSFFVNIIFTITSLFFTPALIFLSIFLMFWITKRAKNVLDGLSACGYILLPLVAVFIGQFAGIFDLSFIAVIIVLAVIIAADILLYRLLVNNINDEILLCSENWGK